MYNNEDLQLLIDNCQDSVLQIPNGEYYINQTVNINKRLKIYGNNVKIFSNEPISLIKKQGYGNLLQIYGLNFSTSHKDSFAIEVINDSVTDTQSYDLEVSQCEFEGYGNGIKLNNTRETLIEKCRFSVNGNGVYYKNSVNPSIINCQFKPFTYYNYGKAVFYDGIPNDGHSCGLTMTGNKILGFRNGVHIKGTDYVDISHNIIDYCDMPIIINDQDMALIESNYIGARPSPVEPIEICGIKVFQVDNDGVFSQHIKILNNTIVTYPSNSEHPEWDVRYGMKLSKINGLHVKDNTISFWNQHAIVYDSFCYSSTISDNICMSNPNGLQAIIMEKEVS